MKKAITAILTVVMFIFAWKAEDVSAAAPSVTVSEINYTNSTITIKANANDTVIYFSDSKGKVWDAIPGTLDSNHSISMDISWITASQKYTIKFKGDASTTPISVVIPKQLTTFRATYNKAKGTVAFTNQGSRTIQWRKKDCYNWHTLDNNTFAKTLETMSTQGASLVLRLAPINGGMVNGVLSVGERGSKEVTLAVPKKGAAPAIKINGSTFSITAAKNTAYRTVEPNGAMSDWTVVTSSKNLLLSNIAGKALYTGDVSNQSPVTLQFRKNATNSSQVSHIATVIIPVQEGAPSESENGISLNYTSSTSLSLTVKAASKTKPFEYTIVKKNASLDYLSAHWTTINSSAPIALTSSKAGEGSHIYVRKQSVEENAASKINFALASKEVDVTGSTGVSYPTAASASKLTTLVTTAGVCNEDYSAGYLTFMLYSPTKTTVSSISFHDQYGTTIGTASIKSTAAVNKNSTQEADKYIITTKITSTENLDRATEKDLYADIVFANGDKLESKQDTGVMLYLYPATKVNNKNNKDYTAAFDRVLYSKENADAKKFTFCLDFGKNKVPDLSSVQCFSGVDTAITSMKYDKYTLKEGSDYEITYGSYTDEEKGMIRTATVTVNVAAFESASGITAADKALPLVISLNNGENLTNTVTIRLVRTAVLLDTPIAWSITEGSLKETTTSTKVNDDKTTTTVESEVITFELKLSIFDKAYDVGVADVTWDGISLLKAANISAGEAEVYLSNAKINKLTTTSSKTNNLIITLSNGYQITTGCKLTIVSANR